MLLSGNTGRSEESGVRAGKKRFGSDIREFTGFAKEARTRVRRRDVKINENRPGEKKSIQGERNSDRVTGTR